MKEVSTVRLLARHRICQFEEADDWELLNQLTAEALKIKATIIKRSAI